MNDVLVIRMPYHASTKVFIGLGVLATLVVMVCGAYRVRVLGMDTPPHPVDAAALIALLFALLGLYVLRMATVSVRADAQGVHLHTWLRPRTVPWQDIADIQQLDKVYRSTRIRRAVLRLRGGGQVTLPLPYGSDHARFHALFDSELHALRERHRRHGTPATDYLTVINSRTAGRSWKGLLVVCVVLLACSALTAYFVPPASRHLQAWRSAVACPAGRAAPDCLSTMRAVVEHTDPNPGKSQSWVYFTDDRPVDRKSVPEDTAKAFQPGDRVTLTLWQGGIHRITGRHHQWTEHFATGGEVAVVSALAALAAGVPAAQLMIRRRHRRLPSDEVLPSVRPFLVALAGTGVWLLPYVHTLTTDPFLSRAAYLWAVPGVPVSAALFAWAWRATRIRRPEAAGSPAPVTGEVFVSARFLDATEYNPHGFGTHIVVGDGAPAVVPHPGPGRFAAKEIPARRLSVRGIRRARGPEAELIPRSWHIAELDDEGRWVRLAAAPRDLRVVLRELGLDDRPAPANQPAP
ncbi:PH domain-containing protein [Streptomyces sp. TRM66268-LWL]|uniref:PH domain-containing protein n=1 Tax=Streptomyces polyasparticus TaxID=2767826 RepID=A0ABR7SAU2_9ACTN|nr:PH domain-containing protein [Streptomyces polyasparticus]MBC9712097.1 PH domain-containing protein [Streptomyces polyasparticus]